MESTIDDIDAKARGQLRENIPQPQKVTEYCKNSTLLNPRKLRHSVSKLLMQFTLHLEAFHRTSVRLERQSIANLGKFPICASLPSAILNRFSLTSTEALAFSAQMDLTSMGCEDAAVMLASDVGRFRWTATSHIAELSASMLLLSSKQVRRACFHNLGVFSRFEVVVTLISTLSFVQGYSARDGMSSRLIHGVEVGVAYARTSLYLLQSIPDLVLTGVDPYPTNTALSTYRRYASRAKLLSMTSEKASLEFDAVFDFAFLDGDHSYESAQLDIDAWAGKVRQGGLLAGHDYSPLYPGVVRAVNEFVTALNLDLHLGMDYTWWVFL